MARILVVDDSTFLVKQIRTFLEADGHEVVAEGHDGNAGVSLFFEHKPDLLLLDLTMPNKDGLSCLEEILESDASARVLIVSAVKDRKTIMNCLNVGAKGFIEKPLKFRDEQFCNEFRSALAKAIENE